MQNFIYIVIFLFSTVGFSQKFNTNFILKSKKSITNVNVYPNPIKDKANIIFSSSINQKITFTVTNIIGKVIYSKHILVKSGDNSIPFFRNKLPEGIYIYTIKTLEYSISKRLVLK